MLGAIMMWCVVIPALLAVSADAAMLRSARQQSLPGNSSRLVHKVNVTTFEPDVHGVSTLFTNRSSTRHNAVAPSMFVAVFTTRSTPVEKRQAIRTLWNEVDAGVGNICARFVVCDAHDNFQQSLSQEHATYGDLLFLRCSEGYAQGLLTLKVIAAMKAYRQSIETNDACLNRPLFMKVDDDTFVSGQRFREGLSSAANMYGELIYAGVDLPSQPPERNPSSHWYEPLISWPHQNYPAAMYGGPGYLLGRSMIQKIVDEGIADQHVLWNEDRAVGVWIMQLQARGVRVN